MSRWPVIAGRLRRVWRRPRLREAEAGFALVDMLAALSVAGLIGTAMIGLVGFVQAQGTDAAARGRAQDGIVAARRVLLALLADAPPILGVTPDAVAMSGDERGFTVNGLGLAVMGLPHPVPFALRIETQAAGAALVLGWRAKAGAEESREVVAEGILAASFAYFVRPSRPPGGTPASGAWPSGAWQDAWSGRTGRLEALRLNLTMAASGSPAEIVVPMRADRPNACLRHPRRRGCEADDP